MAVRAIEYLVQLFPEKTGKEIIELHERDKANEKKAEEKRNAKKLAFMNDINTNGGYYRGRFGYDQHYYYNVTRMYLETNGELYMDVEKIVMFCNPEGVKNIVTRPGDFQVERERKEYQKEDNYMLHNEERVTRKEWDAINDYLDAMQKLFWKPIS